VPEPVIPDPVVPPVASADLAGVMAAIAGVKAGVDEIGKHFAKVS
jgi:hypothetical protein